MSGFVKAVDRLSSACAVLAGAMLAIAALIICWNVIHRAMGASTYWEIEFSVYMMVAALFFGSPYCLRTGGHIGVDLLTHVTPKRFAHRLAIGVALIGMAVCIYLAVVGGILTVESFGRGERTESTWAPYKWPLFLTMPVGLALTALQYLAELLRLTSGGREAAP